MKYTDYKKTKKVGGIFSKEFPPCSWCGDKVQGFQFGKNILCPNCLPLVTKMLFNKEYSFQDYEKGSETYDDKWSASVGIMDVDFNVLKERRLGSETTIKLLDRSKNDITKMVITNIGVDYPGGYQTSIFAYLSGQMLDRVIKSRGSVSRDVFSPGIVSTVRNIQYWCEENIERDILENYDDYVKAIVQYSLGWEIADYPKLEDRFDSRINYKNSLPNIKNDDINIITIREYECVFNVVLTHSQYEALYSAALKVCAYGELTKSDISDLYYKYKVNPVLIDTINIIFSGLRAAKYDNKNEYDVLSLLTLLFGWNVLIDNEFMDMLKQFANSNDQNEEFSDEFDEFVEPEDDIFGD